VPESDELISRLGSALNDALARNEEAERRAQAEAERVARLERELAEAREEIERLRRSKEP
jgi:chromosome segregation ATPase